MIRHFGCRPVKQDYAQAARAMNLRYKTWLDKEIEALKMGLGPEEWRQVSLSRDRRGWLRDA